MPFTTIAALRDGDLTAFKNAFHEHHERVYFYVLKKTNAAYLAEEVTQLTFIKLWQYKHSLDEDLDLTIQLFRIARTTMIDLLRKQRNNSILHEKISISTQQDNNNVWESVVSRELNGRLMLNIEAMPSVRKKVFEMSRFKGMTNKEIAASLSISVKAVEFHITQAIRKLRHLLMVTFF